MHSPAAAGPARTAPGATAALAVLLTINLFNYVDRQVLSAVLPLLEVDAALFDPTDRWLGFKLGLLTSAFLLSYTLLSPIFGWFGDRGRRWVVVGVGVAVWSLASGGSGLAGGFLALFLTRCLVGIGEAAYGPVAPSMLSDLFPASVRGKVMAGFYLAIPVGSALGFVIGGQIGEHFGWRPAFLVTLLGLVPAAVCFFMPEPPRPKTTSAAPAASYKSVVMELRTVRSFMLCCAGMTCTTFLLGGAAVWAPRVHLPAGGAGSTSPPRPSRRPAGADQTLDGKPVVPDGRAGQAVRRHRPARARSSYPAVQSRTPGPKPWSGPN